MRDRIDYYFPHDGFGTGHFNDYRVNSVISRSVLSASAFTGE